MQAVAPITVHETGATPVEGDAPGNALEAFAKQTDYGQPHVRKRAPRWRVLEARQGWLAHQVDARLGNCELLEDA